MGTGPLPVSRKRPKSGRKMVKWNGAGNATLSEKIFLPARRRGGGGREGSPKEKGFISKGEGKVYCNFGGNQHRQQLEKTFSIIQEAESDAGKGGGRSN